MLQMPVGGGGIGALVWCGAVCGMSGVGKRERGMGRTLIGGARTEVGVGGCCGDGEEGEERGEEGGGAHVGVGEEWLIREDWRMPVGWGWGGSILGNMGPFVLYFEAHGIDEGDRLGLLQRLFNMWIPVFPLYGFRLCGAHGEEIESRCRCSLPSYAHELSFANEMIRL